MRQVKANKTIYKICKACFLKISHCVRIFVFFFIDAIVVVIVIEMWKCRHFIRRFWCVTQCPCIRNDARSMEWVEYWENVLVCDKNTFHFIYCIENGLWGARFELKLSTQQQKKRSKLNIMRKTNRPFDRWEKKEVPKSIRLHAIRLLTQYKALKFYPITRSCRKTFIELATQPKSFGEFVCLLIMSRW